MKDMKYSEQDVERILINSSFTNSEHKEALRARLFGSSSELSDTKAQIVNLFDNKEFVDRLMQTSGEEEIARMFSENNVEISKENISVIKEAISGSYQTQNNGLEADELSEDELEMVAGGRVAGGHDVGPKPLDSNDLYNVLKEFVKQNIL